MKPQSGVMAIKAKTTTAVTAAIEGVPIGIRVNLTTAQDNATTSGRRNIAQHHSRFTETVDLYHHSGRNTGRFYSGTYMPLARQYSLTAGCSSSLWATLMGKNSIELPCGVANMPTKLFPLT